MLHRPVPLLAHNPEASSTFHIDKGFGQLVPVGFWAPNRNRTARKTRDWTSQKPARPCPSLGSSKSNSEAVDLAALSVSSDGRDSKLDGN